MVGSAVILAIAGCGSSGKNARVENAASVEQEIRSVLDQYAPALLNKDAATLDRIWADDLSFINPRGELLSKQDRIDNIKTGSTAFKSISESEKQIRIYGATAVVTLKVVIEGQYSGQEGSGAYRVTTVWARPKGAWQMVAVQMTQIPE